VMPHGWGPSQGVHRESWSINGEVCITGLVPPFPGGERLAHCLTWVLHEFASGCRRAYDTTGALPFTYVGPRTPTTLARAYSLCFDLALQGSGLVRKRVRDRGGDPAACRWPASWLEGATYDYLLPGGPIPWGRAPRRKIVLLAEERQAFVPARRAKLAHRVARAWSDGLTVLAGVGAASVNFLKDDEQGFLANILVLVNVQPGGKVRPRPTLEESYRRHQDLLAVLSPLAEAKGLPLRWHALWRLPSGMTWRGRDEEPWMRYPAVSFAVAVRPWRPVD